MFNYSIPQKDIIYYSFKAEPSDHPNLYTIKFYFQILNSALVFNKNNDVYESLFDVKLFIKQGNETVKRFIWVDTIRVNEYVKTNLKDYYYESYKTFQIDDKSYDVDVQFFDRNAKTNSNSEIKLNIYEYVKRDAVIGYSSFFVDDQYYVNQTVLPFNKTYKVELIKLEPSLSTIYLEILSENSKILYRKKNLIEHIKKNEKFKISVEQLFPEGNYTANIYYLAGDTKISLLSKKFNVRWWEKPTLLYEPVLALRPFRLILDKSELDKFNNFNQEEQLEYYTQFWKKNGKITQSNHYNELQDEFFKRVDYAANNFTDESVIGWDTDMGKTHILYGFPNEIDQFYKQEIKYIRWKYDEIEFLFVYNDIQNQYTLYSQIESKN